MQVRLILIFYTLRSKKGENKLIIWLNFRKKKKVYLKNGLERKKSRTMRRRIFFSLSIESRRLLRAEFILECIILFALISFAEEDMNRNFLGIGNWNKNVRSENWLRIWSLVFTNIDYGFCCRLSSYCPHHYKSIQLQIKCIYHTSNHLTLTRHMKCISLWNVIEWFENIWLQQEKRDEENAWQRFRSHHRQFNHSNI